MSRVNGSPEAAEQLRAAILKLMHALHDEIEQQAGNLRGLSENCRDNSYAAMEECTKAIIRQVRQAAAPFSEICRKLDEYRDLLKESDGRNTCGQKASNADNSGAAPVSQAGSGAEKSRIASFFFGIFGKPSSAEGPQEFNGQLLTGEQYESADDVANTTLTSQTPKEPADESNPFDAQDLVSQIEQMDYTNLSDENKKLLFETARNHIGGKYGDLVSNDRLDLIPKRIKIENTKECKKVYEASGGRYSANTVGFYCPATNEIYVDAPRNGNMTEIMATIEHESLHLSSKGGVSGQIKTKDGSSKYRISTNLNEGITELYAIRDMDDMGFSYMSKSYPQQVDVVRSLEHALGNDTIRTAYFRNEPDLIRSEFERSFASKEELDNLKPGQTIYNGKYEDFLNALDEYIDTKPNNPHFSSRRNKVYDMINECKSRRRFFQ